MTDVTLFSRWLHQRQHPADCGATVGGFPKQDYFWGLGFGAQLVSLKFGFLAALLRGEVYHLPTSHYTNPISCPSRSFDCYFQSASNCTRASHRVAKDVGIRWCFDVPEENLGSLAGLSQPHSKEWFHAQLAAFLFRPNVRLQSLMTELTTSFDRSDPLSNESRTVALQAAAAAHPARSRKPAGASAKLGRGGSRLARHGARVRKLTGAASAGGAPAGRRLLESTGGGSAGSSGGVFNPRPLLNSTCVAIHIRRTDKFTTNRREDHFLPRSFPEYAQLFRGFAYWRQTLPVSSLQLLVGSEDKATYAQFPPLVAPTVSHWIPTRYFVMDMSQGKQFVSIRQGNSRLGQLYEVMEARARVKGMTAAQLLAAAPTDAEAAGLLKDEGMVLVAQMILMGQCRAFIGSYASNVAVLVHDFMAYNRIQDGLPMHALDVNGRSYCGCGASFCMTLERKAGRDPTRQLKGIIDGFKA